MSNLVAKLRLETSGGDQSAAEIQKPADALQGVAPAADQAGAAVDRLGGRVRLATNDFASFYDAAQRDFVGEYQRQVQAHVDATQRMAGAQRDAVHDFGTLYDAAQRDFVGDYVRQTTAVVSNNTKVAASAKLTGAEVLNLGRQFADVGVTAAMGMNPLMILVQQGPQIADVFGTAAARGVTFKTALGEIAGMAGRVFAVGGPITIGAGLLGILSVALLKGSADAAAFENALTASGNAAGLTAGSYEDMARRISKATGESVRTSKAGISQLVATGQFSAGAIEKMVETAERYALVSGKSTQAVLADYAGMSQGVTDWAVKHALAHNDLTLAQIDYIAQLEKSGQSERAYQQAMDDINDAIRNRAAPAYGYLQQTMHDVATAASNMWDKILGIGRPETIEGQIAKARQRVEGLASAYNSDLVKLGGADGQRIQSARGAANLHLSLLEFSKDGQDAAARAEAKRAEEERAKIRAKYGSGANAGGGRFDASDMAIEQAARAELQARMALTRNVEQLAALKLQEIDAEAAIQRERVQRAVKEGSISAAAAKIVLGKQAEATALQRELVLREQAAGLAARDLERRQAMGGLQDRAASAEAALSRSTAEGGRRELEALRRRQQLERDTLVEKNRQLVLAGELTEAEGFAVAVQLAATQQAELLLAEREKQVREERERVEIAVAARENQIDILASEAALLKSSFARNRVELEILKAQHEIERLKLEEVIASAASTGAEKAIARARMDALEKIQANEVRQVEEQSRLVDLITEAADAVSGFKSAFGSRNWAGALDQLMRTVQTVSNAIDAYGPMGGLVSAGSAAAQLIGGRTGRIAGTSLGIASMGLGVGAYAGSAAGAAALGTLGLGAGTISSIAALAGPIGMAAAALYAAVKIFNIGGKPSNNGAGFDLVTGQLSGNKRNAETEDAARKAGETILGIQAAFKEAGLELKTTITGLVVGTRDVSQIYTSAGQTLTSAVGDVGAAVDVAMRAILQDASYSSEAQKKLVEGMVATGQGFDAINEALASFALAQKIPQQIQSAILQLTDPKAFAIEELKRAQEEQRKALKAAADAGYLTAAQFTDASLKLDELEGLQLAEVLKQFTDEVASATEDLAANAGRLRGSVMDRLLELTDPRAYQVKRINDDIAARIAEAQPLIAAGVLGQDFLALAEQLRQLELDTYFRSLTNEVDETAKAFQDARPRLLSWIDQIRAGPAGELSAKAAREEALRQYQRELAKAQSGDASALASLTTYAERLLEADRAATGSAGARLALRNQVLGQVEGLAARGVDPSAAAVAALQAPLSQIAAASVAELATLTAEGKNVVVANLPSMSAMYGELLNTQTDRLVAANDRGASEIVASVKALAESQAAIFGELAERIDGALAEAAALGQQQATAVVEGLTRLENEARLNAAQQRSVA